MIPRLFRGYNKGVFMGKIIFITGGARSGKSYHAEQLARKFEDVAYIATGINTDSEMNLRILKHKEQRPSEWITYEEPYEIEKVIAEFSHKVFLIDCITVYVTNLLLKEKQNWEDAVLSLEEQAKLESVVEKKIIILLDAMKKSNSRFIVVSNEVGMGLVPAYSLGRIFRDVVGRANRMIAQTADKAYFAVSGKVIPLEMESIEE